MIPPRAEVQLLHRRAQQPLTHVVQHAVFADLRRAHVAIADQPFRTSESLPLPLTRRLDPRRLDVYVNAVEQQARGSLHRPRHRASRELRLTCSRGTPVHEGSQRTPTGGRAGYLSLQSVRTKSRKRSN